MLCQSPTWRPKPLLHGPKQPLIEDEVPHTLESARGRVRGDMARATEALLPAAAIAFGESCSL